MPHINILSPDGITIHSAPFKSQEDAEFYFHDWKDRYVSQGHYSSCLRNIPLDKLRDHCSLSFYDDSHPILIDAKIKWEDDNTSYWTTFCVQDREEVKHKVNDDQIGYYGLDPRLDFGTLLIPEDNRGFRIVEIEP